LLCHFERLEVVLIQSSLVLRAEGLASLDEDSLADLNMPRVSFLKEGSAAVLAL
jgi:hypothetical protein